MTMPITYLVEAMQYVVLGAGTKGEFRVALAALLAFGLAAVAVAGVVVRRAG